MAEFTPIMTQEEFDTAIGPRLERERNTVRKEYADYETIKTSVGNLQRQLGERDKTIGELNQKIKGYETDSVKTRIALETGLPMELRSRLTGETEAEIRADAEALAKLIGTQTHSAPPLKDTEPAGTDIKNAAFKALLSNLKED